MGHPLYLFCRSILNWENKLKSAGAFVGFLLGVWFFEPWMITFGLLFPFIGNIIILTVTGGWNKEPEEEEEEDDDDSGDSKGDDGEKKSLKEKMQAMQEIALQIQVNWTFVNCKRISPDYICVETSWISCSCVREHQKCFQLQCSILVN